MKYRGVDEREDHRRSIDQTSLVVSDLKPPRMTSAAPNLESDRSWAGPRNIEVGRASQGMSAFPWCWLRLDSILIPNLQSEINWDQLLSVEITASPPKPLNESVSAGKSWHGITNNNTVAQGRASLAHADVDASWRYSLNISQHPGIDT